MILSVGIIGGSYGGLALARSLQLGTSEEENIRVIVLEKKPHDEICNGTVQVANAEELLRKLLVPRKISTLTDNSAQGADARVQRQALLTCLADGLTPGTVLYNKTVVSVRSAPDHRAIKVIVETQHKGREAFLFDYVVAADGLTSPTRSILLASTDTVAKEACLLLGDAGVQFGCEFMFGLYRIQYGLSSTLDQACGLSKALRLQVQRHNVWAVKNTEKRVHLGVPAAHLTVAKWYRTRLLRRVFLFVVFLIGCAGFQIATV